MNTTNHELENPSDSYDSNENISSNNFNNKVYSNLEDSYKSNLDFLPKNLSQNTLDDNKLL